MADLDNEIKRIEQGKAWDESDEVVQVEVKKPLDKVIPVRLPAEKWEELRKEARGLGIGPTTLARMWLLERLRQGAKAGIEDKPKTLVDFISKLSDFKIESENLPYGHMGATITDTMLQPGLTWETTVKPRLDKVRKYPEARTTSGFLEVLETKGTLNLLDWNNPEKPNRILAVTKFFKDLGIETELDLKNWFGKPGNDTKLLKLRGIGPKTLDYLKKLSGISGSAVDRHLREFVKRDAGISVNNDVEIKTIVDGAAELMSVDKSSLDLSIWRYKSQKKRSSGC